VRGIVDEHTWRRRFEHIRGFERLLADEGTTVLKMFLHVSPEEQLRRLRERLEDPEKRWKFSAGDLDDRRRWDEFAAAYEDAIRETSTEWAPWYVIPADHSWVRNLAVAALLVATLDRLDPKMPQPDRGLGATDIV
jgi:polyphosphate kinase 2 (PPK2 family)